MGPINATIRSSAETVAYLLVILKGKFEYEQRRIAWKYKLTCGCDDTHTRGKVLLPAGKQLILEFRETQNSEGIWVPSYCYMSYCYMSVLCISIRTPHNYILVGKNNVYSNLID